MAWHEGVSLRYCDLQSASDVGWGGERLAPVWVTCCHGLMFSGQRGSIYQSHQQKPTGRCAACYLTWLSGSSSAHYSTQTHSPVMIYCLSAYGIMLEPPDQKAARCFSKESSADKIPGLMLFLRSDASHFVAFILIISDLLNFSLFSQYSFQSLYLVLIFTLVQQKLTTFQCFVRQTENTLDYL